VLNRLHARIAVSEAARWTGERYFGGTYDVIPNGVDTSAAPRGPKPAGDALRIVFVGREEELLFTTMAHQRLHRDVRESDQAVVEYVVERDPDRPGEEALFRRSKPRIDDEPDRGGRKDLVADRVTSFRLRYWDPRRAEWAREWTTRTTEHAEELPSRVRFELEVAKDGGGTEKFVTEARIALRRPLTKTY